MNFRIWPLQLDFLNLGSGDCFVRSTLASSVQSTVQFARAAVLAALMLSSANAEFGSLSVTPAATLERGTTIVAGQRLEFRLTTPVRDLQTATLNLTRAGRSVGEYAMRRDGVDWTASLKLELPYAYIATVRLFEKERVWAGASDLYALESQDAGEVKAGETVSMPLELIVTEGKPGGDTNPIWGIAATLVLIAIVAFGAQMLRRKPKVVA